MQKVAALEQQTKYGEAIGQLPKAEDYPEKAEELEERRQQLMEKRAEKQNLLFNA